MPKGKFSDITEDDFMYLYHKHGPHEMRRQTGLSMSAIHQRRRRIESKYGPLRAPKDCPNGIKVQSSPQRRHYDCLNGVVIIGSDAHICRDGPWTTAQRAFLKFIKELKPRIVIANGDVLDLAAISRHDPLQWEDTPPVIKELEAAQKFMAAIEDAAPSNCKFAWPAGNHDARFQARLAKVAPEYSGVRGTRLKDHFSPKWEPCYSAFINNDVVVKHRLPSGQNLKLAVMKAGRHIVIGHHHAHHVQAFTNYSGTWYGMDAGMLADPQAEAFSYTEDNPMDWRAGFGVLTFHNGQLLPPELVTVWSKHEVVWRGQIIRV